MKKSVLLSLVAFPFCSMGETISIAPQSVTNVVYSGFSESAPVSQTPTEAIWGGAWLIGSPFWKVGGGTNTNYPMGWRVQITPNANVPSHNSGKLGSIYIDWVNDNGNIVPGEVTRAINLPSSGNTGSWCYNENNNSGNAKFQWKIRRVQFDKPLAGNVSWKLTYVGCGTKNEGQIMGTYIIGYTNQTSSSSGCDINFTNNFNVIGEVNKPILITETGLSKSRCTSGNKYSLSFSSSNPNIKIVPPNNGTPTQSYTIGDVSTVTNDNFPYYRVEPRSTAGMENGIIQLNLTSK
ncbi:MAG: hypothetical protein KH020_12135 [Clostridiales bacterium]|nr:hypothetical protein [Clostridiales bacterium]